MKATKAKRLGKPVQVRLRRTTRQQALRAACRLRLSPAELIRRAVDRKLPEWEASLPRL